MGVHNEALHFTPALRNLALEEDVSLDHHANVAEVARELFIMKTERDAEAKANVNFEAKAIVAESQRKITKADRLQNASIATGPALTVALSVFSVAIPFLIPVAIASASVATGTLVAKSKINVKEEEEKVWVYTNFPEAVRSPYVKKEAYKILEKEKESQKELDNLRKNPKYHWVDGNDEDRLDLELLQDDYKAKKDYMILVKTAETNALKEFIKTSFYK